MPHLPLTLVGDLFLFFAYFLRLRNDHAVKHSSLFVVLYFCDSVLHFLHLEQILFIGRPSHTSTMGGSIVECDITG